MQESVGPVMRTIVQLRKHRDWKGIVAYIREQDQSHDGATESVAAQQQLGFALNRAGRDTEAERVLEALVGRGDDGETLGILGRVYKDRWERATRAAKSDSTPQQWLDQAIATYLRGFERDPGNAYPGINAVTLLTIANAQDPRTPALLIEVENAVKASTRRRRPDYFDHATRLELAVLRNDTVRAMAILPRALRAVREPWEPETTAHNLALLRRAREPGTIKAGWSRWIENRLLERAGL